MIGLIRVFTTEDQTILEQHGHIITNLYGVPVLSKCIPDQPLGVFDDVTKAKAVPKIMELGKELEESGCKLLVVSCAEDPAVEELRGHVSIPVIGGGSAAALTAKAIGQPIGVMGICEYVPLVVENILGDLMVRYIRPEGITNTTDLMTEVGRKKALGAAQLLLDEGAKVILFACTGFSTIGFADILRKELHTIVIDAVEAEGLVASAIYKQLR